MDSGEFNDCEMHATVTSESDRQSREICGLPLLVPERSRSHQSSIHVPFSSGADLRETAIVNCPKLGSVDLMVVSELMWIDGLAGLDYVLWQFPTRWKEFFVLVIVRTS
jgi:hypothetical protein